MKRTLRTLATTLCLAASFHAFAADDSSEEIENTDVVASGTYMGTALKVDADEQEVYLKTEDGKILELYFKEDTKLTKDGETVEFSELKKDQPLKVTVEKSGNHVVPVEVVIQTEEAAE